MINSDLMMAEAIMDEAQRKADRERLLRAALRQVGDPPRKGGRTGVLAWLRTGWGKRPSEKRAAHPGGRLQTHP
jgi:hypothetical protein